MMLLKKVNFSVLLNALGAYYVNSMKVFFFKYFLLSLLLCTRFLGFWSGSLKGKGRK